MFSQLPAASQFDLAASNIDDDALEQAGAMFGGPAYGLGGFGISDLTTELLSRDPRYVPVKDLAAYQASLVATGYLPPTYQVTGEWDDTSAAASRRSERDSFDLVKGGSHFLAAPVRKFFEYLTDTTPKRVIEGAIGIATGIKDDAVKAITNPIEVAEEGGALGTGLLGAGIGTAVAGPLGGLVGFGIGAVGGFFADFFGEDEQEENQNGWSRFWDAWTPADEIKAGDASNLFAALSTVMTASAVLKGVSLTTGFTAGGKGGLVGAAREGFRPTGKGIAGVLAGPSLAPGATTTIGQAGFREAFRVAARDQVSVGMANKLLQSAIARPVVGGAAIGGVVNAFPEFMQGDFGEAFKQFGRGAVYGAIGGPITKFLATKKGTELALRGLNAAPLRRIEMSGAGQIARAAYTGVATATIGARLASELPGEQSVEKAIEQADIGLPGHILDWSLGLAVYPERLLPWRARDMSRAVQELGSNNLLEPWAKAAQRVRDETGNVIRTSLKKGYERVFETLGRNPETGQIDESLLGVRVIFGYQNKGLDDVAELNALTRGSEVKTEGPLSVFEFQTIQAEERSKIVSKMYQEAGDISVESSADELAQLFSTPTGQQVFARARSNPYRMQAHIEDFDGSGSLLEHSADHMRASEILMGRTRVLREAEGKEGLFLIPARRDDPVNGVTGYQTKDHFNQAAKEYREAAEEFRSAREKAMGKSRETPEGLALQRAGERLDTILIDLKRRQMIDQAQLMELGPGASLSVVDMELVGNLERIAKTRPFEIPDETARLVEATGNDRYIALSTGENMLLYDHIPKNLEIAGIAELTRRTPFRDSLATLARRADRLDVGRLRYASIVAHLDGTAQKYGFGDGKEVTNRLYDYVRGLYDERAALARGERVQVGRTGVRVKTTKLKTGEVEKQWYRVVPQDLSAKDIQRALNLDAPINGVDPLDIAVEFKNRLMVGAAFGADMAHPIRTARNLVQGMGINGLPGFSEFMRTAEYPLHRIPGLKKWAKEGSYGYISHHLRNTHMALQFSISPTFDTSRMIESASFGKMNEVPIKATFAAGRHIREGHPEGGWLTPYGAERVSGTVAYQHHLRLADEVMHQRNVFENFEELRLRSMHHGIMGFKPREVEAAHVWMLAQKKLAKKGRLDPEDYEEIRETVLQIHQYGGKQTMLGNSIHFVFFPYLFTFKQLRQIHDFTLGAPVRNLLVHEGMRRWDSLVDDNGAPSTLGQKFIKDFKEHVPLAHEVARLNNLSYGLSLGRFVLEGFDDVVGPDGKPIADKSSVGKAAQALTSFLLPGGVHQPVAEAVGSGIDAFKALFVPVILADDGEQFTWSDRLLDLPKRLAPIYRDVNRWFFDNEFGKAGPIGGVVGQTVSTLLEGTSPMAQFQQLMDFKDVEGYALDALAKSSGYASWASMSAANPEMGQKIRDLNLAISAQYPSGQEMQTNFENSALQRDQMIYALGTKPNRTEAEEAIFTIGTLEQQAKIIAGQSDLTQEEVLRKLGPIIRGLALRYANDRQFMSLYEELFKNFHGPVRVIAA